MKTRYYKYFSYNLTCSEYKNKFLEVGRIFKIENSKHNFSFSDKIFSEDFEECGKFFTKKLYEIEPLEKIQKINNNYYTNKIKIVKKLTNDEFSLLAKKELSSLLIKNDKPLQEDKIELDIFKRIIIINEEEVTINFCKSSFWHWIIKTKDYCTINAGYGCIINTGKLCTINIIDNCQIKTKYGCTINSGTKNIINCGALCKIKTENRCDINAGGETIIKIIDFLPTGSKIKAGDKSEIIYKSGFDSFKLEEGKDYKSFQEIEFNFNKILINGMNYEN